MQLPHANTDTVSLIYQARLNRNDDGFRPHLGASQIGIECSRALWYSFRWAKKSAFDGRMLRLFDRGQKEEARFIEELRWIGCKVHDGPAPGEQYRVSACGGHFGGSMDGAVVGLPESPKTWHVVEFKTHNEKSFKELEAKGVEKAKPQHYAQMQVYMALTGMERALYLAANKNTDELYSERVSHDADVSKKILEKADRIIFSEEPPPGISKDPAFFQCKWCDYSSLCFENAVPAPTCRSCAHVTPEKTGCWSCVYHKADDIPFEFQKQGCEAHRYIPKLLENFADMVDASQEGNRVNYKNKLTGYHFVNAEGGANDYQSKDIHAAQDKRALGDPAIEEIREDFDAEVIG